MRKIPTGNIRNVMKTKLYYVYGVLSALISSCTITEIPDYIPPVNREQVFKAIIEQPAELSEKTYVNENLQIRWNRDDRLSVFNQRTVNQQYVFNGETGDKEGTFSPVSDETPASGNALSGIYAVYPYNKDNAISSSGVLSIEFPSEQTYTKGSFGYADNTMIAVAHDDVLTFKNAGGYLMFKLYGEGLSVESLLLRSNGGETIAGGASVSLSESGVPSVKMKSNASHNCIILNCDIPVPLGKDSGDYTEFWFVLPPVTLSKGFTLTVVLSDGSMFEKSTSSEISIPRNHRIRMAPVLVDPDCVPIPPADELWYTSVSGKTISPYKPESLNANIVSNTYDGGKGIIKFDAPLTVIGAEAFHYKQDLNSVTMSDSVTELESSAFDYTKIQTVRLSQNLKKIATSTFSSCYDLLFMTIPASVTSIGGTSFINCRSLRAFYGKYSSEDHRLLISNNQLIAFAPAGITTYEIPEGITSIATFSFFGCSQLVSLVLPETLVSIYGGSFMGCSSLTQMKIPDSVTYIPTGAFGGCTALESFSGKFATSDARCLVINKELIAFAPAGLTSYIVPNGIEVLGQSVFSDCARLQSVSLPTSLKKIQYFAFGRCTSLEMLVIPTNVTDLGISAFSGCKSLGTITVEPLTPPNAGEDLFKDCAGFDIYVPEDALKNYQSANNWSNYSSRMHGIPIDYFYVTPSMVTLENSGGLFEINITSNVNYELFSSPEWIKQSSVVKVSEKNWIHHFSVDENLETTEKKGEIVFCDSRGVNSAVHVTQGAGHYTSTDYSQDGVVTQLQKATVGNGIDIILMGDAFSDRQIADGTYAGIMHKMMAAFFSEEPYASICQMFNVYMVNVVSLTEGYDYGGQALGTWHGDGTHVGGNNNKCLRIAQNILGNDKMSSAVIAVAMNTDIWAGTCYMYLPSNTSSDYGEGTSIAYFAIGKNDSQLARLLHHEACGHGFAKLADEYFYEENGRISSVEKLRYQKKFAYGWWKNVDFTNNPADVKWRKFLEDSRYESEGLGVYEGACTYYTGAFRPSVDGIMRSNALGFNAPCREAIWYRAHKLAYGENWQYDYENFVSYDEKNRQKTAITSMSRVNLVEAQNPPLHSPVIVPYTWEKALGFE